MVLHLLHAVMAPVVVYYIFEDPVRRRGNLQAPCLPDQGVVQQLPAERAPREVPLVDSRL